MAQEYWIKLVAAGEEHGPYTGSHLRQYAASGQIQPESLVSLDRATWHPARRIKGLFPAPAAAVATPAPVAVATHAPAARQVAAASARPAARAATAQTPPANTARAVHAPPTVPAAPPIHYASGPDDISPERQYAGVFLMLKITAWFFVIVFTVAALIGFYAVFADVPGLRFGSPPANPSFANRSQIDSVLIPGGMLLLALLFAAGNILGFSSSIGRGSVLTAAGILILLQVSAFAMHLLVVNTPQYKQNHESLFLVPELAKMAATHLLWTTFALLCIVALVSELRRRSKATAFRSAWLPLAKTIAALSASYGLLLLVVDISYLRIEASYATSFSASLHSPSELTRILLPFLADALYMAGGIAILLNRGFGRFLIFPAMAYEAFWVASALIKLPQNQLGSAFDRQIQISWCSSFILFAVLACIILLQRRLFAPAFSSRVDG